MTEFSKGICIKYVDLHGGKILKAVFVNASDALIFWNALSEKRRRWLVMETVGGEPINEVAHTGWNEPLGGYYSHAEALTESKPLPPREHDREKAQKAGWEFVEIDNSIARN